MKVSTESTENSQVMVNVEMEAAEVEEYVQKAYSRLVGKVSVPGFRKGKTPRNVLERHIGKEALFKEALEDLIPTTYEEALASEEIDAIDQPKVELLQTDPVIYKATVPVRPTIKLGEYRQLSFERKPVEVVEEEVETAIGQLRDEHAVLVPVDRPVRFGDTVTMDVEGESNGEPFPIREGLVYEVVEGTRLPLPGFAEKLEGMVKGEQKSFQLSYPSDYEMEELAGQERSFRVTVTEIKEKELPEMNDEFARTLGSNDLASLREQITASLKTRAEQRARLELQQEVVDAVANLSEMEYPSVLVDREIDRLLEEEARNFAEGVGGLENYLKSINKTMEGHRDELRPMANESVSRSLVLEEIVKAEKVEVDASEIDEEIGRMANNGGEQAEQLKAWFNSPQARESVKQLLSRRKAVDWLMDMTTSSG